MYSKHSFENLFGLRQLLIEISRKNHFRLITEGGHSYNSFVDLTNKETLNAYITTRW